MRRQGEGGVRGSVAQMCEQRYRRERDSFMGDLVSVLMGNANTFYWESTRNEAGERTAVGMLEGLRQMMVSNFGAARTRRHCELLSEIEATGGPRQWALLWIVCATVDPGLRQFVSGTDEYGVRLPRSVLAPVATYVGMDGCVKHASDPVAVTNYLRDVLTAFRAYVMHGCLATDRANLYAVLCSFWMYGGRAAS